MNTAPVQASKIACLVVIVLASAGVLAQTEGGPVVETEAPTKIEKPLKPDAASNAEVPTAISKAPPAASGRPSSGSGMLPSDTGMLPPLPTMALQTTEFVGVPPGIGIGIGPGLPPDTTSVMPSELVKSLGPPDMVNGFSALGTPLLLPNGFTHQGAEIGAMGGSFGRVQSSAQFGKAIGNYSFYVAGTALNDPGWHDDSTTRMKQIYSDLGWRDAHTELHANVLLTSGLISGSPVPVDLLAADRTAAFTQPNTTATEGGRFELTGRHDFSDTTSLSGSAYYGHLYQSSYYTIESLYRSCASDPSSLCSSGSDIPVTDVNGNRISNWLNDNGTSTRGPYADQDHTTTHTESYGASLQLEHRGEIFGQLNRVVVGGSFDGGNTRSSITSTIGGFSDDRAFVDPHGVTAESSAQALTRYYSIYAADDLAVTERLRLALSARYNVAELTRYNGSSSSGDNLDGTNTYSHFNPAVGLSYAISPGLFAYGGYSVVNRAPTPDGLACTDTESSCFLPNYLIVNPVLKQVVSNTVEAGLRGQFSVFGNAALAWNMNLYRTDSTNDLLLVDDLELGRLRLDNIGNTRRQGVKLSGELVADRFSMSVSYTYTDARFRSDFDLLSPENPGSDSFGTEHVKSGDHIPGIPANKFRLATNYAVTPKWSIGAVVVRATGQYLYGDEVNAMGKTRPYTVVSLNTHYWVTKKIELFGFVQNLFNTKYATFGSVVSAEKQANTSATNPRAITLGDPFAVYGGFRFHF